MLSSPYPPERFLLIVRQPKLSVRTDVKTRRNLAYFRLENMKRALSAICIVKRNWIENPGADGWLMLTEAHWQDEWELDKIKFVLTNNTIFRNCLPTVLVFILFNLVVHIENLNGLQEKEISLVQVCSLEYIIRLRKTCY